VCCGREILREYGIIRGVWKCLKIGMPNGRSAEFPRQKWGMGEVRGAIWANRVA
jgi:hypothetical protein